MSRQHGPTPAALKLVEVFDITGASYVKWVHSRQLESGVSFARLRLLGVLHTQGPRIMSGLGEELGVSARYVTSLVDGLEQEGLVRRVPHPTDRRATIIEATPKGGDLGVLMSGPHQDAVARLFDCLTGPEQEELLRLLGKVRGELSKLGFQP